MSPSPTAGPDTPYAIGRQALTYTFPLFETLRMRSMTAARRNALGEYANPEATGTYRWLNTFAHSRHLLKAGESRVVTPNYDTLYSNLWLDLTAGPRILNVPDTADRYYVLGFLDAYTNPFRHIGRRTTGTAQGSFLVAGPDWQGPTPAGMQRIDCPTNMVWVIGRILVDGPADVPAVNALQEQLTVTAPDGSGAEGQAVDTWMTWRHLPDDVMDYLRVVQRGMRENPPPAHESALMADFARIGLGPQASTDALEQLDEPTRGELARAYEDFRQSQAVKANQTRTGWSLPILLGESFGDDYQSRADVAHGYIGALCSEEAMYPMTFTDAQGQPLNGAHRYRLHFDAQSIPPVDCFWSVTLYDRDTFMLVPNPIDRYAVGDRSTDLHWGADGSLELWIQRDPPRDPQANWLPAPEGDFYLCLRAYQPRAAMLEGQYLPPDVQRLT